MTLTITPETTNRYEPQIEDEIKRYIKIRVRQGRVQWNAVIPVSHEFLERRHSFLEWQERLATKYEAFSGFKVDRVLESGEISEAEANAWWAERDSYGRPIPDGDRPSPADCF